MNPKETAAEYAARMIVDGMNVGLGTGSTAAFAILALGRRVREEGLRVNAVATSRESHDLALQQGVHLCGWDCIRRFDISIDGADEVDPQLRLIKGGGGALVREKIVAAATDVEVIIVDPGKVVPRLGARALPVAVIPFGWQSTRDKLESTFHCPVALRKGPDGAEFVSDDNLVVLDMHFGILPDPDSLEARLKAVVGVVEVGLFVGLCQRLVIGHPDGRVEERIP